MGLVDYSESDSSDVEVDAPAKAPAAAPTRAATSAQAKRPFQKVVDRSNPGKIVLNLPQPTAAESGAADQPPPTKRAKTGADGLFSGFNSFLPAPKNAGKAASTAIAAKVKPGVNLRTSAAPGFSREAVDFPDGEAQEGDGASSDMKLRPPTRQAEPSIPEGQKAAEDVKLVGKPLMFKPLSVGRNTKKKGAKSNAPKVATASPSSQTEGAQVASNKTTVVSEQPQPEPPKKVSLFSMHTEEPSEPLAASSGGAYEPLFETENPAYDEDYAAYANLAQTGPVPSTGPQADSLDTVADDLNLTAAQKRELFGRDGSHHTAKRVVNFNMDREYRHNEELRASGEQQVHNPVRAIQAGKHSLQQLVRNVQNQKDALQDSFAQGKSNRREASSRYGW